MFDLSSRVTGVCLWDLFKKRPEKTSVISVQGREDLPEGELFHLIGGYFDTLQDSGIPLSKILVSKEAMPSQLRGRGSTVQTFLALARSHAVFNLYMEENGIDVYDYTGVYPVSTHSYFRRINSLPLSVPVGKEEIKKYVLEKYQLENLTLDESDAVFLAETLLEFKWNRDLQEEIRVVKKHSKGLKTSLGINRCLDEEKRLEALKLA